MVLIKDSTCPLHVSDKGMRVIVIQAVLLVCYSRHPTRHWHEIKLRYLSKNPLISDKVTATLLIKDHGQLYCDMLCEMADSFMTTLCTDDSILIRCVTSFSFYLWPLCHFFDRCSVEMTGNDGEWKEMTKKQT